MCKQKTMVHNPDLNVYFCYNEKSQTTGRPCVYATRGNEKEFEALNPDKNKNSSGQK
jgi:hypothetical protein